MARYGGVAQNQIGSMQLAGKVGNDQRAQPQDTAVVLDLIARDSRCEGVFSLYETTSTILRVGFAHLQQAADGMQTVGSRPSK